MKNAAIAVLLVAFLAVPAPEPAKAVPADGLVWKYSGHASLLDAAATARKDRKRLLVGLSGSPT